MATSNTGHKALLNPWNCVHGTYLLPPSCMDAPVAGLLQSAEDCGLALTFTSVCQEEKLSRGRAHWTSSERGARWENKKIRWKRAQLWPVVNNMKEARARGEHVVAVETEQGLNKSTIGRIEAAEAECGEMVCCSLQHASAFPLSELSNMLGALFTTSMSMQVLALRGPMPSTVQTTWTNVPRCTSRAFSKGATCIRKMSSLRNWGEVCF